jgi:hypothetical protein
MTKPLPTPHTAVFHLYHRNCKQPVAPSLAVLTTHVRRPSPKIAFPGRRVLRQPAINDHKAPINATNNAIKHGMALLTGL